MIGSSPGLRARAALAAAVLAAGALFTVGCSRPWQVARTVVVTTAGGVAAADRAIATAYEESGCSETEDVPRLERCVEQLGGAAEVLANARASLLTGESIVDAWKQSRTEPADWRAWAETAGQLAARVTAQLAEAGVAIPREVRAWAAALDAYLERLREED